MNIVKETLIQHGDDPGRKAGLGLLQISVRIVEIAEHVPASSDKLKIMLSHDHNSCAQSSQPRPMQTPLSLALSLKGRGNKTGRCGFFRHARSIHKPPWR